MRIHFVSSSGNNKGPARSKFSRIALAVLSALIASVGWFFLQVQSDYYAKVSVNEAVKFAEQVAAAVNTYYFQRQIFPSSLSEIALPRGEAGYIPNVTIDPVSGVLTVDVITGGKAGTVRYIPNRINHERLQWRCENVTISKNYLPAQCRS